MEDKKVITKALGDLLKLTRMYEDLDTCEYEKDDHGNEHVIITGKPNSEGYCWKYRVNVTWDSGIALLRDVLRQLG